MDVASCQILLHNFVERTACSPYVPLLLERGAMFEGTEQVAMAG